MAEIVMNFTGLVMIDWFSRHGAPNIMAKFKTARFTNIFLSARSSYSLNEGENNIFFNFKANCYYQVGEKSDES